jgi:pimeloyl-ACP methyl ester carboxylesterase
VTRYRRDMKVARQRLTARPRRTLEHPRLGVIEFATLGQGPAVTLSHPLFGGFDIGAGLAETYIGADYRFIAPSRFGYLGSTLPQGATPADQADAYAAILDALSIERTVVFGYSAGGPSVIQFTLRYPERTSAVILMASALPGKAGKPPKIVAQVLYGSDLLFWALKQFAPRLSARILGMPKGFRPTAEEVSRLTEVEESMFPHHPRRQGALFDGYVSNPDVQHYPLDEISTPTLIINAKDDGLAAFDNAARAAERIARSKLLTIERGGHLLLGSESTIRKEIAALIGGDTSADPD